MKINLHLSSLISFLTLAGILLVTDALSQPGDTAGVIHFPLPYEGLSLFYFAGARIESKRTETQPAGLNKKKFQSIKTLFQTDSLYFEDSVQTVWLKFTLHNDSPADSSVALIFLRSVGKADVYKYENDKLIQVGRTGYLIAVLTRSVSYQDNRIDLTFRAKSQTVYLIQVSLFKGIWMPEMPVLQSVQYAEVNAFYQEKKINRPKFLLSHFFTGIFFVFFVFGFIKYLVVGRDRAYLFYAMLGLANALLTIAHAEYPPLEFSWFGNFRGIELFNLVNAIAILMQGLFILEILQLKIKYPRITRATKWFLFSQLFVAVIYTVDWIVGMQYHSVLLAINTLVQFSLLLIMCSWVLYLAAIQTGFYRFIFYGALTIFIAFVLVFTIRFFHLFHLLPAWFGDDPRGNVNQLMQIALVIDMIFYFTGLAHRDRQVENEKSLFQEQLIKQLEANKILQEKFTGELEQQVREKSTELLKQRQALEMEKEEKLLADFNRKFSESELKALRSQMNPHFIFNILNTIESYALESNKEAASTMIRKFSRLTRLILENSMNSMVLFEQDWKALQLYIELEQMRYTIKFATIYTIQEQVLEGDYYVPPMIIQPFVENAILHGLRNKTNGEGVLQISAHIQDGFLVVKVEDNGIGRVKAAALKMNNPLERKSVGIQVTSDRISMLNNLGIGKKAHSAIEDLQQGTKVTIWLPQ